MQNDLFKSYISLDQISSINGFVYAVLLGDGDYAGVYLCLRKAVDDYNQTYYYTI